MQLKTSEVVEHIANTNSVDAAVDFRQLNLECVAALK
jgi:hypothetical protein